MCKYVLLLASFGCLINSYSEEVLSASNLSSWRRSHVGSFLSVKSSKRFARGVFDISQCFILCLFKGDCVFDISQCFILCLFKAKWHYSSVFDISHCFILCLFKARWHYSSVFDISHCFISCLFKGDCVFDISHCFILCLFKASWHYSRVFDISHCFILCPVSYTHLTLPTMAVV